MFNKKDINIQEMTEEKRKNPELLKERDGYKNSPVAIYYGSKKKGLTETCLDCKKRRYCEIYFNAKEQAMQLERAVNVSELTNQFSRRDIEKLKNNVFIIVNCIHKERG